MLEEDIKKIENRLNSLSKETNSVVKTIYKNILLEKYDPKILLSLLKEIEQSFLSRGNDYIVIKIKLNNIRDILNNQGYYFLTDLKTELIELLDENVSSDDLVSRFKDDGFLVVISKIKNQSLNDFIESIKKYANELDLVKENNISLDLEFETFQRTKYLGKNNFLEVVLK